MDLLGDVRGTDHTGDEPEVRRQAVVESVHDRPQHAAGAADVPRLPFAPHHFGELARVDGGFRGDVHRRPVRLPVRRGARQPEVRLHFAPFFRENQRQDRRRAEPPPDPREQPRAARRRVFRKRPPRLLEEIRPTLDVPVLDRRQPQEQVAAVLIRVRGGELAVEKRRVLLVGVMLVPALVRLKDVGARHPTILPRAVAVLVSSRET